MNISYDYYRVFYYVAKYKSFTGAAGAMMNNQPNVTRMIKRLEEELGCTLFIRQRHGVTLTPEGEKLYAHISVACEHIACGEQEIARDKSLQSGIVTVAATEITLRCILLPALKKYRKAYPGIRIRILNYSTPQAIDVLKNGLVDFAIVTEPFKAQAGLSSHILRDIQEVPVCSNSFVTEDIKLTPNNIKNYPLIGLGEATASFSFYADYFNKIGVSFAPDIEAATADQILPMIKSDLGVGFIPVDFLGKDKNLRVLDIEPKIPPRNICILKKKDISLSIAASELWYTIERNYRKNEV